jgi:hypothetical protein
VSTDWVNLPARLSFDPACDCMVCRGRRHRAQVWARYLAGEDYHGRRKASLNKEIPNPNWKYEGILRMLRGEEP